MKITICRVIKNAENPNPTTKKPFIQCMTGSCGVQMELFQSAISCWECEERNVSHLAVIMALKKISNHPVLLRERDTEKENVFRIYITFL